MEQPEVQDSEVIEAQAPESTEAPQNEDDQLAGLLEDEQQSDDEIEDEPDGVKVRGKRNWSRRSKPSASCKRTTPAKRKK